MEQLCCFADERLIIGCIYCGGLAETREHVPSRVFLDLPYPTNLPVVGACRKCNNDFSLDEEYLACLIESAIAGTPSPEFIRRSKIADILWRTPALRARLESAKICINGQPHFAVEHERIKKIVMKLARGHAAFELSQICRDEPISVWWHPIATMDEERLDEFEEAQIVETIGEIGSRGMQRWQFLEFTLEAKNGQIIKKAILVNDWIDVQKGCYRYYAIEDGVTVKIKLVIGEYLACEVVWQI